MEKKNVEHACFDTFWKMIKPEHKYFYGLFLCSLFGNLLVVAMPLIMGIGIDDLLSEIRKQVLDSFLSVISNKHCCSCLIADRLFSLKQHHFIYSGTDNGSVKRKDHIEGAKRNHKNSKHYRCRFDNHQVGDIISRTTTGLNQLSQVLLTGINQFYFCRNNSCCWSDAVLYRKQAYFARLIADRWQFNCYN